MVAAGPMHGIQLPATDTCKWMALYGGLWLHDNEVHHPFEGVQLFQNARCLNMKAHNITHELIKKRRHDMHREDHIAGMITPLG